MSSLHLIIESKMPMAKMIKFYKIEYVLCGKKRSHAYENGDSITLDIYVFGAILEQL